MKSLLPTFVKERIFEYIMIEKHITAIVIIIILLSFRTDGRCCVFNISAFLYCFNGDGGQKKSENSDNRNWYENGDMNYDIDTNICKERYYNGNREDTEDTIQGRPESGQYQDFDDRESFNRRQRRTRSLRYGMAGFGPATFRNVEADAAAYNFFGGYLWEVNPYAAMKGILDATTDFNEAILASLNIGANFYPVNADISPLLGASLGLAYIGGSEIDDNFGFDGGFTLGAQLFRTSDIQMLLEVGSIFHFREVDESIPFIYTARIGVLF